MRKIINFIAFIFVCAVSNAQTEVSTIADVLTYENFSANGNSYENSEYTSLQTGIVYSANSAMSNNAIQLRTNNSNSGIVSTSSEYAVDKVIIDWYSTGNDNKKIDVYAKASLYSKPTDLYDKSKCGTLIGTVDYSAEPCTLDISGDYKYIGVKSNSGTIYINSVSVLYKSNLQSPNSYFEKEEINLKMSDVCYNKFTTNSDGAISYTSSNDKVATIDNEGNVTLKGQGVTTISAITAKTENYTSSSASYKLIVTEDAVVWSEDFSTITDLQIYSPNNGVELMSDFAYSEGVLPELKISSKGYFNVAVENLDYSDIYLLSFKSNHNEDISVNSATDGASVNAINVIDSYQYKIKLNEGVETLNLKITNNYASNSRVDDFILRAGYVRENLTIGNIGTLCLPFAIKEVHGAEIYSVAGKRTDNNGNPMSIVFEEVTEDYEAGVPYVFKATAKELTIVYKGDVVSDANNTNSNGLIGTLNNINIEEGYYILTSNTVQKCGTGCNVNANRAYFDMNEVPEYVESNNSKRRLEVNGSGVVNSIDGIINGYIKKVDVYNVCGVKIRSGVDFDKATIGLNKGLYIIGNKKVIIR